MFPLRRRPFSYDAIGESSSVTAGVFADGMWVFRYDENRAFQIVNEKDARRTASTGGSKREDDHQPII